MDYYFVLSYTLTVDFYWPFIQQHNGFIKLN